MNINKALGMVSIVVAGVAWFTRKYSSIWFSSLSDDELNDEREKVRQEYCSPSNSYQSGVKLQQLLYKFDDEIRRRSQSSSGDCGFPVPTEHGWYLSEDDD